MTLPIAIASLVVAGLPLAFAVTRRLPLALLLAPLVAALFGAVATMLMLLVGGDLLWWLPAVLAGQLLPAWWLYRRDGPSLPHGSWLDAALLGGPLCLPFLMVVQQPIAWDAHSIWWLHSGYFSHGAEFARESIANPAYGFSHPDYPPLASAPVAAAWSAAGGSDFRLAQVIVTLLNFSAITMLVYAVRRVTDAGHLLVSWPAAIAVGLATWALKPGIATDGMSDGLWAASFTAAAVLLLLRPDPLARPLLPLLLMTVAGLTKNEGLVMVFVLSMLVTLRVGLRARTSLPEWRWTGLRRIALVWCPAVVGAAWAVLVRRLGGSSDLTRDLSLGELRSAGFGLGGRLAQVYAGYERQLGTIMVLAGGVAVLGALFLRRRRRELGLGSDGWLWVVSGAYCLSLTATYVLTPYDLSWHLRTSITRVLLPLVLLACVSAACWAVVAAQPEPAGAQADGSGRSAASSRPGPGVAG